MVMLIAWAVPVIMANVRVIKIPPVIIEITLGFIIGRNVLGLLPEAEYMDFLAKSGFLFLLFMSGLETDVNKIIASFPRRNLTLKKVIANPFLVSLIIYFASLLFAILSTFLLGGMVTVEDPLFLGLVIPTVALSIVVPVLKEQGDIAKEHGQVIMLVGAVSTIFSILLISFYSGILQYGLNAELFLFLLIFVAFFVAYWVGKRLLRGKLFEKILYQLEHASSQIKVRGTITLILLFVVVAAVIKVELVLGAFLAGILLSLFLRRERSALMIKLDGMSYGFFVPIFFIMVGANLDLSALDQFDNSYLFLATLLLVLFATQVIPAMILSRVFGKKTALSSGILLTSRLGLTIATAQIGLELGVISPALNAGLVITAIITSLVAPVLYNQLHPQTGYAAEKTIIIGADRIGILLAERLKLHNKEVVIVEVEEKKAKRLVDEGYPVIAGAGMDKAVYEKLNLRPENYVVVLTGSEQRNVMISQMLKKEFNHDQIITEVLEDEFVQHIKDLEVAELNVRQILATAIENMIFRPDSYHLLFEDFGAYSVQDITVGNNTIDGIAVKDVPFHQEASFVVIRKGDNAQIPHGNTVISKGDVVTVIGNEAALQDLRRKLE